MRAGVGVILDLHGTVFDAFASVCAGHLEGQVEACHVSRIAQDSGSFVLSRNWWKSETRHVPEREYFGLLGALANLIFPYGNIMMLTSISKMLKYSRTVTSPADEGYEIHTRGHRQVGPTDPQGAWRDAKGSRSDLGHGSAIHHRTRKRKRDRRNR